uniref:Ion_trans_2 domain-containing protein n=1 Tax=Elaeophora elaphi TaxID=1147741 RepID=A0A0R3RJE3_9BILA
MTLARNILLQTLWVACRAIIFGGVIITFGILMTILGYFDVYLSQEIVYNGDDGTDKMSTNWTKRYLFKSLQYLGPIAMGIGSFILIVACVITLESRDKNTEILHSVEEVDPCKKTSSLQKDVMPKHLPMTDEEIREWTPLYKAVPLSRHDSSPTMDRRRKYRSTPCIPQMFLDSIDNRKLYGRYFDNYYCGIYDTENDLILDNHGHDHDHACMSTSEHCSHWSAFRRCIFEFFTANLRMHNFAYQQDVTVELHSPPSILMSNAMKSSPLRISPVNSPQKNHSSLHLASCSTSDFRRTNDFAYGEHSGSNIVVTIDPATISAITDNANSTTDIRPSTRDSCVVVEEFERHAPLASLDIEFATSSSSSSSNVKVSNVDNFFTI